jgi:solute carrier family 25 thiamine pyrophosphate transporter 19
VKKRYQVAGLKRGASYGKGFAVKEVAVLGIFQLVARTMKEEGIHGIYKGVTPSLLKSAPSAAITFAVYSLALEFINKKTNHVPG